MRIKSYEIVPRYPSGRRVWVWFRAGRWGAHLEIGSRAWHIGGYPNRVWRAPWQRWPA